MDKTSKRLKELREEKQYSLSQVANAIGVSKSTIFRWENGTNDKISRSVIQSISKFYGVSPLYIIGTSDNKSAENYDALEEHILKMFRDLSNSDKIRMYEGIKVLYNEFKNRE